MNLDSCSIKKSKKKKKEREKEKSMKSFFYYLWVQNYYLKIDIFKMFTLKYNIKKTRKIIFKNKMKIVGKMELMLIALICTAIKFDDFIT